MNSANTRSVRKGEDFSSWTRLAPIKEHGNELRDTRNYLAFDALPKVCWYAIIRNDDMADIFSHPMKK
ncbi:hypothetical protein Nepgr_016540 [Nepenthes gracilis]|uniref:Uncharacterized protein n=1 Tax=Nepenthes gracilis TaxID=150966 RepID=A0AAD3XS76_NEPGR|nr:hypothetical protein Nepgr_016540 [Nepenthes gracilis]